MVGFVVGFVIFTVVLVEVGTVETVTAGTLGLPAFCGVNVHVVVLEKEISSRAMSPVIL